MIFLRCLIVAMALTYCGLAVAQHTNRGHHNMQPPPTPSSMTLTPATQTIPSTDTSGTVIGIVSVTMSDGSSFSGSYSVSPTGFFSIVNNQQIVDRNLTAADAGTDIFTVTATENNGSATAQATIIVAAPPPPPPPPLPPPPPPPPTLTMTFNPRMPSIPASTPRGTTVATVTAAWSDGSPFSGTLMFTSPYENAGGTFALSCQQCATANIVLDPTGPGISQDGGMTLNISVVATQ